MGIIEEFIAGIGPRPKSWQGKDGQHPLLFERPWYRTKAEALSYPLISHSNPARVTAIAVDVDHADAATRWAALNLPAPNIIVVNPKSGRAHYIFVLAKPVVRHTDAYLRVHGKSKAWQFYEAMRKALTAAYQGDPSYNEDLVKNPLHPKWNTMVVRQDAYLLGELYQHPGIRPHLRRARACIIQDERGRNCTIYKSAFVWAVQNQYRYVNDAEFRQAITGHVYEVWANLQHPNGLLEEHELVHIINSVERRIKRGSFRLSWFRNRGAAKIDANLPLWEKQRLGQAYTAETRKKKSLHRIEQVVRRLGFVSKQTIANVAQVGVATVYRLWTVVLNSIIGSTKVLPMGQYLRHPTIDTPKVVTDTMKAYEANALIQAIIRGEIHTFDTPRKPRRIDYSEYQVITHGIGLPRC